MDNEQRSSTNTDSTVSLRGELARPKERMSFSTLLKYGSLRAFVPRLETFRWVIGVYFLILGMSYLLLPQGSLGVWLQPIWLVGAWMLLTGLVLLWLNVLTLPTRLVFALSVVMVIPLLIVSGAYLLLGVFSPVFTLVVFILGILISPFTPPAGIGGDSRPDALGLMLGAIVVVQGLDYLRPSSSVSAFPLNLGIPLFVISLIFIVSGCAVIITQLISRTPIALRWIAHLGCGLAVIGFQATIAAFIDPLYWMLGAATFLRGFATILLPWWSNRAARFDRSAFRPRIALALTTASLVPIMIALPVVLVTLPQNSAEFTMEREVAYGTALLMMILCGIGGWWLAGTLTTPLTTLMQGVDRITEGRHTIPLPRQGTSELVRLSQAVEQMAHALDERAQEQAELTEQLAAQNMELKEAEQQTTQQMDSFLGIVSHELKTPITVIKGNLQLAARKLQHLRSQSLATTEDAMESVTATLSLLDRSQRQLGMQTRLVNDLIDVSRIQTNSLELQLELQDLVQLVQEVVEDQRMLTPTRQITLHSSQQEVPALIDQGRIGQVITNYLTNALKYSESSKPVEVNLGLEGAMVRVAVRDYGPGLALEQQQHIWERFHRVPGISVKSGSGVGLGLGLYICKQLIERQGGQVGVESTSGQGSTFWFTLPRIQS